MAHSHTESCPSVRILAAIVWSPKGAPPGNLSAAEGIFDFRATSSEPCHARIPQGCHVLRGVLTHIGE